VAPDPDVPPGAARAAGAGPLYRGRGCAGGVAAARAGRPGGAERRHHRGGEPSNHPGVAGRARRGHPCDDERVVRVQRRPPHRAYLARRHRVCGHPAGRPVRALALAPPPSVIPPMTFATRPLLAVRAKCHRGDDTGWRSSSGGGVGAREGSVIGRMTLRRAVPRSGGGSCSHSWERGVAAGDSRRQRPAASAWAMRAASTSICVTSSSSWSITACTVPRWVRSTPAFCSCFIGWSLPPLRSRVR
jgi:hypothetical protein